MRDYRDLRAQFAESEREMNERLRKHRLRKEAESDLLTAAKEALWVLDNISAIMSITTLQSTLTDPRPALRAAIAKATGGAS